jgi:hypothetical protein
MSDPPGDEESSGFAETPFRIYTELWRRSETSFGAPDLQQLQSFTIKPTKRQSEAIAQEHRHSLELAEQQHQREEAVKDNEVRRIKQAKDDNAQRLQRAVGYYSLIAIVFGSLIASGVVAVASSNAATRDFAQGACFLILGGITGATAGYFTGKNGH